MNATEAAGAQAATLQSPCTSVCRMSTVHPWCEGCHRSIDEIAAWSRMNDDAKRIVWNQLPERRLRTGAAPLPGQPKQPSPPGMS